MKSIAEAELLRILEERSKDKMVELKEVQLENLDLSRFDLHNVNFAWSDFKNVNLEGANFENSILENTYFSDCSLRGAILRNSNLGGANFRFCDLSHSNIEGANLFCAVLEGARLDGIRHNENTKYFRLYCPEKGPFLGYKQCFNYKIVQLLIPADARRTSGTTNACRCNKAKVLSIKSYDLQEHYMEARSLVNENFVYRVGEMAEVADFNEDRWYESTTGIHFWMTRNEAMGYLE